MVRQFANVACSISAYEAEQVGVEHLLREIKDLNRNSVKSRLLNKVGSLVALNTKIGKIVKYLESE